MPDDRVVVITGSTRGIGRGLAEGFARAGCRVVVSGRDAAAAAGVAAGLGEGALAVACDVTDPAQVQAVWDRACERFGRVDIWINNAGVSHPRRPLADLDPADIAAVADTNVLGTLNGCRTAIKGMIEQGDGWVWVMEGFGSNGMTAPGLAVYGASKRAVSYLTKALRKETAGTGVKVGWLSPGIVATDLLARDYHGQPEAWQRACKIFSILGDEVATVTPFLVRGVLRARRSGTRIAWLTRRKAFARFATSAVRTRSVRLPELDRT